MCELIWICLTNIAIHTIHACLNTTKEIKYKIFCLPKKELLCQDRSLCDLRIVFTTHHHAWHNLTLSPMGVGWWNSPIHPDVAYYAILPMSLIMLFFAYDLFFFIIWLLLWRDKTVFREGGIEIFQGKPPFGPLKNLNISKFSKWPKMASHNLMFSL